MSRAAKLVVTATAFVALVTHVHGSLTTESDDIPSVAARFLVTVNYTFAPCTETVATPFLLSGRHFNQTVFIKVGDCDNGPLTFTVRRAPQDGYDKMVVDVTFYTSVFHAMPPECSMGWNGTYVLPSSTDPQISPLPGCFVEDSQEGYNDTQFWFHLLEWRFL